MLLMIQIFPAASLLPPQRLLLLLRRTFRTPTNRYQTTVIPATSNSRQSDRLDKHEKSKIQLKRSKKSTQLSTPDRFNRKSPRQTEPDLFYLNILNDAVKETTGSSRHHTIPSTHYRSNLEEGSTRQNWAWAKLPKLDDIDNDYLVKKGVFDLPAPRHL
jgi:hypothetical protein